MDFSHRKILSLSIPNILAAISAPLMGLIDLALVGHLDQLGELDGVIGTTILFDSTLMLLGFFRMATTGLTAQAYGARDHHRCIQILIQSLCVVAVLALVVMLSRNWISTYGLGWTDMAPQSLQSARDYFHYRIWGFPAALMNLCFFGWFLGMGQVKRVMGIVIFGNVLNALGSAVLVHGLSIEIFQWTLSFPKWGVEGSAIATATTMWICFIMALGFAIRNIQNLKIKDKILSLGFIFHLKDFFQLGQFNLNLFLRTLSLVTAITYTQIASSKFGGDSFAGFNLCLKIQILTAYFIDGFAHAAEILVGQWIGFTKKIKLNLSQRKNFISLIHRLLTWGMGTGLIWGGIFLIFWTPILSLMTHHQAAIQSAQGMLPWMVWLTILSGMAYTLDGIMVGATQGPLMRNAMIVGVFAVFFPIQIITTTSLGWGISSFWLGLLGLNMTRNIWLGIRAYQLPMKQANDFV